jgi:aliphatic nitrilase
MAEPDTLHLGAAQVAEVYFDTDATVEKALDYVERAGERGIDVLVFPEFLLGGNPHWYKFDDDLDWQEFYVRLFEGAVTVPGPEVDRLCAAAREHGVALVVGANEKEPDTAGTMYNSLVFVDADGTLLGSRRKLVPTVEERLFHTGGTGHDVRTFDSSVGTLGGLMCSEHHNPLASFSMTALGEDVHAAAWPAFAWRDRERRDDRINVRTRYHAFSGGVPTASAVGVVDEGLAEAIGYDEFGPDSGGSAVINTEGEFLAGPLWEGEGIVSAEVTRRERVRSKSVHDTVGHYNRFDVFSLEVHRDSGAPIHLTGEPTPTERGGAAAGGDVDPKAVAAGTSDAVATALRDALNDGDEATLRRTAEWAADRLAED